MSGRGRWLLAAAVLLFAVVLLRTAWLCDDAYITLRSVDHLVRGFGPVFNAGERVQAYSHPLWMLLLTPIYAVTRDGYWTLLSSGLVVSAMAAGVLVFGVARSAWAAAVALLAWTFSRAAIDFSTSGLENPLSHLLLLGWVALDRTSIPARRRAWLLPLIAGLGALTRHDLVVVFAPLLIGATIRLWREEPALRRRLVAGLGLAIAPLLLWTLFSIAYYGFPLPNPAYAKQFAGLPRGFYLEHGLDYLRQSSTFDLVTPIVIAAALLGALLLRGERRPALAAALLLHLGYVLFVGGDFMRGRMLSVPFVLALGWLATTRLFASGRGAAIAAPSIVALGLLATRPTITSGSDFGAGTDVELVRGIIDERAFYFRHTGLLAPIPMPAARQLHAAAHGSPAPEGEREVVVAGALGLLSWARGPSVYVLDDFALADPLLARLPAQRRTRLRIGHLVRTVPAGYEASLRHDDNELADPRLAELYDHVRRAVHGPLFTRARWRSIWLLNAGPSYAGAPR